MALAMNACDNSGVTVTSSHALGSLTGELVEGTSDGPEHVDCGFLQDASGRRVTVFYPDGWEVLFHPVRLIDPSGDTFATEGDQIRVVGPIDGVGASICSSVAPFRATSVERLKS